MAITTQLVGKLGGGKVEKIQINFANPTSNGTHDVVTVPIPEGVPHLIVLEMKTMEASGTTYLPNLYFGTLNKGSYSTTSGPFSTGGVRSSPVTIKAQRNGSSSASSAAFTGTVYYAPTGN